MENTQNGGDVPKPEAEVVPLEITDDMSKHQIRLTVWRHLERNGFSSFPRPVFNRIPNFKGSIEASERLAELDVFKNAHTVMVNPDKPQEPVRMRCLEQNKTLYVPITRMSDGLVTRVELPEDADKDKAVRSAVHRKGMEQYGKPVGLDEELTMDLMVVGAVAVSKEGYRIGKGKGYADLEFGMAMHLKAIKPNTVIVTTVHDCQVFDTLPSGIFGPHDLPVDVIVTPTKVIETQRLSQRPTGILWNLLSNRRLQLMPTLVTLRDKEIANGKDCHLKEEDTDIEENPNPRPRIRRNSRRNQRRYTKGSISENENDPESDKLNQSSRNKNRFRRRQRQNSGKDSGKEGSPRQGEKRNRYRKPRPPIQFSVKISNIDRNLRVRDLKSALAERGVKAQIMTWKGFRGFAYLHFVKPNADKIKSEGSGDGVGEVNTPTLEWVCEALANLTVIPTLGGDGAEGEGVAADGSEGVKVKAEPNKLVVEPAKPLNRIETAQVTAV